MKNKWQVKSNYQIALDNIKATKQTYENALHDLGVIITGINQGILHGKKEQGLINKVKSAVALVTSTNLAYCKAQHDYVMLQKYGVLSRD